MDIILKDTRKEQYLILDGFLRNASLKSACPSVIYLYGMTATGKTTLCQHLLSKWKITMAFFDVILHPHDENYFFQSILHQLYSAVASSSSRSTAPSSSSSSNINNATPLSSSTSFALFASTQFDPVQIPKCTTLARFLHLLSSLLASSPPVCIVLDNFHLMASSPRYPPHLLASLLRISELLPPAASHLSLILVGQPSWGALRLPNLPPLPLHFPPYSVAEIQTIILYHHNLDEAESPLGEQTGTNQSVSSTSTPFDADNLKGRLIRLLWQETRHRYIRSLSELYHLFCIYWPFFVSPVLRGEHLSKPSKISLGDFLVSKMTTQALYLEYFSPAAPSLIGNNAKKKQSLFIPRIMDSFYLHEMNALNDIVDSGLIESSTIPMHSSTTHSSSSSTFSSSSSSSSSSSMNSSAFQSLPKISKVLLIASYLASHIPSDSDQHVFLGSFGSHEGGATKKKRTASSHKKSELSGPMNFATERMLEIFKHLLKDIDLQINVDAIGVYEQIASLIKLNYLIRISNYHNISAQRLRVNISKEDALLISASVCLEIEPYLYFH